MFLPYAWDGRLAFGDGEAPLLVHEPADGTALLLDLHRDPRLPPRAARAARADEEALQESLRLLCVGLTRAKHAAVVTWGLARRDAPTAALGVLLHGRGQAGRAAGGRSLDARWSGPPRASAPRSRTAATAAACAPTWRRCAAPELAWTVIRPADEAPALEHAGRAILDRSEHAELRARDSGAASIAPSGAAHGIKEGIIDLNPLKGFEKYGVEKSLKYIPPAQDIKKILEVASETERAYLITLLHTMGRMREIHKLKWEDVNFKDNYLILRTRKAKSSNVSIRRVPLTATLRATLENLARESEYVFTNPRKHSRYDNRIKLIKSLCRKVAIKEFSAHNLRHFGASVLADKNVSLSDIQSLLGHTRVTTTATYIQSINPSLSDAINKLDE